MPVRVAVEQVLQTASSLVEHRLSAREALTILTTLTREAVPAARDLRRDEPDRADAYRQLLLALGRELRRQEDGSGEARHLHAVTDDLAKVLHALE